jgi:hypothetical protein
MHNTAATVFLLNEQRPAKKICSIYMGIFITRNIGDFSNADYRQKKGITAFGS